jgi:hypothetical protein
MATKTTAMKKLIIGSILLTAVYCCSHVSYNQNEDKCFVYDNYAHVPVNFNLDILLNISRRDARFIPSAQRLADTLAWKTFIALNWPADDKGNPDEHVCLGEQTAKTVWEHWTKLDNIISTPDMASVILPQKKMLNVPREYLKFFSENAADEFQAAEYLFDFKNKEAQMYDSLFGPPVTPKPNYPVVDQNGNKTYFQTFYNKAMTDYISRAGINNVEGMKKFVNSYPHVDNNFQLKIDGIRANIQRIHFPLFVSQRKERSLNFDSVKDSILVLEPSSGSIMIKTAWKILANDDDPGRFYTRSVFVMENNKRIGVEVGLVAMHIAIKYSELPQWLWATFEHTDNVPEFINGHVAADPLKKYHYYNNKYGDSVNESPDAEGKSRLARLYPITSSTHDLNNWMHKQMVAINDQSVWQHYNLVGSQWPLDMLLYPVDEYYTGNPRPHALANAVIENYTQKVSCMSCHAKAKILLSDSLHAPKEHSTNFVMGLTRLKK